MLDQLTVTDFLPLINQGFLVAYPDHTETLTLVEAKPSSCTPPPNFRHGFALLFEGESTSIYLNQGIHPLTHATMGRLDLFLVPLGPTARGNFRYEAAFG